MEAAKISLSPQELQSAADAGVILTKNSVIKKAQLLLGEVAKQAVELHGAGKLLPFSHAAGGMPKISRGENYLGLPWVMLDYPGQFSKSGVFAIRCLFWWGHYFTCTLQLSGGYKTLYQAQVEKGYDLLCNEHWLVYTGHDEWQHSLETGYVPVSTLATGYWKQHCATMPFIKLTRCLPLEQWDAATDFYDRCYNSLAQIIRA